MLVDFGDTMFVVQFCVKLISTFLFRFAVFISYSFYASLTSVLSLMFQKQPSEIFYKKAVLKICQYSQENACVRVSF